MSTTGQQTATASYWGRGEFPRLCRAKKVMRTSSMSLKLEGKEGDKLLRTLFSSQSGFRFFLVLQNCFFELLLSITHLLYLKWRKSFSVAIFFEETRVVFQILPNANSPLYRKIATTGRRIIVSSTRKIRRESCHDFSNFF